jgi:hypothetical protein
VVCFSPGRWSRRAGAQEVLLLRENLRTNHAATGSFFGSIIPIQIVQSGVADYSIPDLTGWEAFCPWCEIYGAARRAQERDVLSRKEYFEFVCMECHTVLLTFQRAKVTERFNEQTP